MSSSPLNPGSKILVALGGNALIKPGSTGTYEQVVADVKSTAESLAGIVKAGFKLTVTHGNGPQVGAIVLQNGIAADKVPEMPLHICVAQTQGSLGFLLQSALSNAFKAEGLPQTPVSLVTQVVVDGEDPAFGRPTKPIGKFYSEEEAKALGVPVVEDAGRGWRKVVASPEPVDIVEKEAVSRLVNDGYVVVASGGGGIPVVRNEGTLSARDAVIDKDRAAALMANMIDSDALIILTDVDAVYTDFRDPEKKAAKSTLSVAEAEALLAAGEFAAGSMGPKVESCVRFVKATGKPALITSLDKAVDGVAGTAGTRFTP